MLREPIWSTSATSRTASSSRGSITSVTTGNPVAALASASSLSPSAPRPWKAYGEVRGLYAPPRSRVPPASATAIAVSSSCARDSTAQGPAISANSSPPIFRPAMSSTAPGAVIGSVAIIVCWSFLGGEL